MRDERKNMLCVYLYELGGKWFESDVAVRNRYHLISTPQAWNVSKSYLNPSPFRLWGFTAEINSPTLHVVLKNEEKKRKRETILLSNFLHEYIQDKQSLMAIKIDSW